MGLFGEENVAIREPVEQRIARYERTRPIDRAEVHYVNFIEGERMTRAVVNRPDLLTEMYNAMLRGEVGRFKITDSDLERRVYWAMKDLGLEIRMKSDEPGRIEVVNPRLERDEPRIEQTFPTELMRLEERYVGVGVIEVRVSLPGEVERYEKRVVYEIDQKSMSNVVIPEDKTESKKGAAVCRKDLLDNMMVHMGNVEDTRSYLVLPFDPEVEKAIGEGGRIVNTSELDAGERAVIDEHAKTFPKMDWLEVVEHGFGGEKELSIKYAQVARALRRLGKTAVLLPSLMGADGCIAKQKGKGSRIVDQDDQTKQLEYVLITNGMYKFAVDQDKGMGVSGHSMGGDGSEKMAADHQVWFEGVEKKIAEYVVNLKERVRILEDKQIPILNIKKIIDRLHTEGKTTEWLGDVVNEGRNTLIAQIEAQIAKLNADVLRIEGTKLKLQIGTYADEPCYNAEVSKKLIDRVGGIGALIETAHALAPSAPELVDLVALIVNEVKAKVLNTLKYGKALADGHAYSLADRNNPTPEELEGIKKSKGIDKKRAEALRRVPNLIQIFVEGDDLLDYQSQVSEANRLGIDVLTLHVRDGDHFGPESPEHKSLIGYWDTLVHGLTREEWVMFDKCLREATYKLDDGIERYLIPRGVSPLGISFTAEELAKRVNDSGVLRRLQEMFKEKVEDEGKVSMMLKAVMFSYGRISYSSGDAVPLPRTETN